MNIEAADRPFNLDKLLKYSKTLKRLDYSIERTLFPFEINELSLQKIRNFENLISESLRTELLVENLKKFFHEFAEKLGK
jgi:hypothetical protein